MFLSNKQLKELKKNNWTPMETEDGTAWFGGKTHSSLAKYISKDEIENFQDIDFLVIGYSRNSKAIDFTSDWEKMRDFFQIAKEEFLASYSYVTEAEYDATAKKVKGADK